MPSMQTQILDSSQATVIDGASEEAELEEQLRQAQYNLDRVRHSRLPKILRPGEAPPPGAVEVTDVDENGKLVIIGYRLPTEAGANRIV
jgi:hypothetical protein